MQLKDVFFKYRIYFIIAAITVILLTCSLFKTFSESSSSSAWDGEVAREFHSGTGSVNNPYVISNAGEFAYFKEVLEGDEANLYADKNFKITNSLNYGKYELSINNTIPFSGTLDGEGNLVYNATIVNNLFNLVDKATIKNINFGNIEYSLNSKTGALIANQIIDSTIDMVIFSGKVTVASDSSFGGFVYSTSKSNYSNIIINTDVKSDSKEIYNFAYLLDDDNVSDVLIKNNGYSNTKDDTEIVFNSFDSVANIKNLDEFTNNDYKVTTIDGTLQIENLKKSNNDSKPSKAPVKSVGSSSISEHASGKDGTTLYINDITADYNYLKGLNFTEVRSTSIPSGVSTGYYDNDYLVKVELIYDAASLNNTNLVGAVSPINNENTNKIVYYKYYPLERNTNGSLATDSNGDNYIRIELLDNPFSKRPYTTQAGTTTEYGFNGWVCNQEADTTTDLCSSSKFIFDNDDYTRYLEIPVDGGSEIIVHLNVNWYEADVVTSASDITDFNSMSMQPTSYTATVQESHPASYYWKQNYAQMVYDRTVSYNNTIPRHSWYRTSETSGTYIYVNRNNTRCYYDNCYVYTADRTAIASGSKYEGGTVSFIPNFNRNSNNTEVTINTYNTTYMNLLEDPDGEYTLTVNVQKEKSYIPVGNQSANGFFYRVTNPTTAMINTGMYYSSSGTVCTSANSCTTAYKLIQYDDDTVKSNGNSISNIEDDNQNIVDANRYYYLVTRDMNIFRYTSNNSLSFSNLEEDRPFTVTGTSLTGTSSTGVLEFPYTTSWWSGQRTYSDFKVANDLVIENIKINGLEDEAEDNLKLGDNSKTSQVIYANSNNLKIGRNVVSTDGNNYLVGEAIFGGTNGRSPSGKQRVIIESGSFYAYHSGRMSSSTINYTFNETTIFGSDYDRVLGNNDNLKFLIGLDGYAGGNNTAGNDSLFASYNIIKSGSFGFNANGTPNTDNTSGLYIGARASTYMNSLTGAKIEGGLVNTIVGGYGYNGSNTTNSTFIGMSGGSVRSIYGGAGHSTTKGNRIICVTGGVVNYSILGGSDSYDSGDTEDGIVEGSTLVYVGGNATIGGGTGTLFGVEAGSVFGAGGGDTTSTQKGTVYNSHVIINGGTISTGVYGGGNHGSTGTVYDGTSTAKIEVLAGNVGNVYGGSKSAGFSQSNYQTSSTIDIDITGGTIANVYGGSNNEGIINGKIDINVTGGTITGNVYGGGRGGIETNPASNGTTTTGDVMVVVGNNSGGPNINGNVYGGSAFGSVNASNNGNVTVTVNDGVITGSVFGGGEGDSTHTPTVNGNITVNINGGDITSVYGGNDQAGTYSKTDHVYLKGGTIGSVYGGGNRSSVTNTNVHLQGSTVTTIYGGSNALGDVTTTNVEIASGTVGTIYGGNNVGGTCATTNVSVNGSAKVTNAVYGGGNAVDTTTTNVSLVSAQGAIPNVYGGGNSASVTTSNVTQSGTTVTKLFGGSNSSGTVTDSYIIHNNGNSDYIYGGNNAGGNTLTSHISFNNGVSNSIYGGGNEATSDVSNISVVSGTVSNVFGGGNNAGLTTSNVSVTGGAVNNVYGGSDNSGLVTTTNVIVDTTNTIQNIYGGGNKAAVGTANVTVTKGTINNVFGGGNLAEVQGNTNLDINGGKINNNVYGGGNYGVVRGNSLVTLTDVEILGSAYAGGNGESATLYGNTHIIVDGNTIVGTTSSVAPASGSIFGGGNRAVTGMENVNNSVSVVDIAGGKFYGNVYGGANTSVIHGSTVVNIGKDALTSNTDLTQSDIYIKGHIFGGGEANASGSPNYDWSFISVTEGTHINIDADTYTNFDINGSFYGGGNASSASGDSYLNIKNYGVFNNPKRNVSIQRVTYVVIDNSNILLKGAVDRANDYATELFAISRVEDFVIKNNTSLFFETGANLLENFQSLDASGNPAVVTIDENSKTITNRTVDNRVYMYEGKNLNIAKNQQVSDYGEVNGMSFLGIFNYDNNNNVNTGIYNKSYNGGDLLDWSGTFSKGSYVVGKHTANHNIKVDGFYSNYINEDTTVNEVKYIEPTPDDAQFYMWFIGENVIEINVNLTASKYSTLGSVETPFYEFSKPNTSFQILSFDSADIAEGISLVDKNSIPRIASTEDEANTIFGLSMEASNSGWLTTGKTNFYTREPAIGGETYYEGENTTTVPTMLFYLYHSKNISIAQDLGTVHISIMAITKINALSNEIKRLVINVNMSTALFQTTEYEGAMTPGDKYELFASTQNNITTKSKFSAYFALYSADENLYRTGYHRVLTSSFVFPENTKITMLDYSSGNPQYYYHVITAADVTAATAEFDRQNEASYPLSMFTKMGSMSNNSNYDDAAMNIAYYDGTDSSEEFIFIVDFGDANINTTMLRNKFLIEMRDGNDESIISVLGIERDNLLYNLYSGLDSQISLDASVSDNPLYIGYNDIFDLVINYQSSDVDGAVITDTQYFDSKLGSQIYILNSDGNIVSGTDLTGTYFMMDGIKYYPDIAGYTHIKLSNKIGNTEKWIIFNTDNSTLATGDYTFVIETFASADGIYYSSGENVTERIPVTIISSKYGLNPVINDESVILNGADPQNLTFNIAYTSMLENPSIRVAMYRRRYDEVYDTNYELVDLQDYVDQSLFGTNNQKEYLIIEDPNDNNEMTFVMKDNLLTGTYRLSFRLYDNDTQIGEVIRYIIIK